MRNLRVLALEAYYGGSHRQFLDTWIAHSRHDWTVLTLPARHWKWRMRGSALWFAEQIERLSLTEENAPAGRFDVLFTSDMTSITDLKALWPAGMSPPPVVCYFHENQLTYPLSPDDWRDFQYGFTNITSALAADGLWFNSASHRDAFLASAGELMGKMSDFVPVNALPAIQSRACIQYPVVEPCPHDVSAPRSLETPVRILWSHRWEYDKDPDTFMDVIRRLDAAGADFELVLVGEQFRTLPAAFRDVPARLRERVVHAGFIEDRNEYWRMISSCDVIVSTAIQENFGLAVCEAILAGCFPLLPNRLSYPELIPREQHAQSLYASPDDLLKRLQAICCSSEGRRSAQANAASIQAWVTAQYAAPAQSSRLDDALGGVSHLKQPQ